VANRADGTVSLLNIGAKQVELVDTIKIAEPDDSVADVEFLPDGRTVLASISEIGSLAILSLSDGKLTDSGERIKVGNVPYEVDISPDGKLALAANVGAYDNTVAVMDLSGETPKVVDKIYTAPTPECVTFSSDGKYVVVSCIQYSSAKPDDPKRQEHGQVIFMERDGNLLSILDRVLVAPIPQAAIFSPDNKYVVVGSFEKSSLTFYRVKENGLENINLSINVPGHPVAMRVSD
jgi:WD40 repeat protein